MKRIVLAALFACISFVASADEICLLYCPTEVAEAQCRLSWGNDGTCSCTCKTNVDTSKIPATSSTDGRLSLRLREADGNRLVLAPAAPAPSNDLLSTDQIQGAVWDVVGQCMAGRGC